jgi:hypothetical protein
VNPIVYKLWLTSCVSPLSLGTISPTQAPVFSSLTDAGGCAPVYDSGTTYEADKVSVGGNGVQSLTYQCKSFTDSGYCNQYEPGHWSKLGWKLVGYCEGAISPTSAPAFSALTDHNGCPNAYDASTAYEASDKVAIESTTTHSVVYQCSGDVHQSRYCAQYEPGNDYKLGWKSIGYCDGTISPTLSPDFASLERGDWRWMPQKIQHCHHLSRGLSSYCLHCLW